MSNEFLKFRNSISHNQAIDKAYSEYVNIFFNR